MFNKKRFKRDKEDDDNEEKREHRGLLSSFSNRESLKDALFTMDSEEYVEHLRDTYRGKLKGDVSIPIKDLIETFIQELKILHNNIKDMQELGFGSGRFKASDVDGPKLAGIYTQLNLSAGRISVIVELLDKYADVEIPKVIKELIKTILNRG